MKTATRILVIKVYLQGGDLMAEYAYHADVFIHVCKASKDSKERRFPNRAF